ncbi:ABC-type glycerol-3-phosphate transport system substrate-binding protein [Hydrogenispora ethanolica]|uniref:ABC-type glycerol-3-phosphate transport system substrate-binding protein n=1 Tax=Hydrogenispora ethanolica TaxID=1082276 RepID=A0A4R1RQ72_HYDET|nr:extracellular solute-binding protein [Hydrogenispora ethanolica]TCL68543.1 ABC-type glycerol-3-phosphate transport system substrate-binding protein [Hydrogenispora ethanolica]
MSRKIGLFGCGVILLACVALLVAGYRDKEPPSQPVTITVGDWPREDDPRRSAWNKYVKIMRDQYRVTVVPDEWSYSTTSFLPRAAAGKLPTIFNTWFTEPQKIIEAGYAADITPVLQKRGWDREFEPEILRLVQKDGRIYGVPKESYLMGLMCNLKLFRAAGLVGPDGLPQIPRTYEELAQTARRIREKTGRPGFLLETSGKGGGWHFMNIAWSYGAEFERKVAGKWRAVFNSPAATAALQYVKDLKWRYDVLPDQTFIDWSKGQELIATGQCAMKFDVGFDHDGFYYVIDNYGMKKADIAMGAIPAGPRGRVGLQGGDMYMFAPDASPEQIDAALQWLQLLGFGPTLSKRDLRYKALAYRRDNASGYVVGNSGVPVWLRQQATNRRIRSKYVNVNLALFQEYLNFDRVRMHPEEPINCQELYKILDRVIQTVLTDPRADPGALLDRAAAEFQTEYLDKSKR